ncbi:uncharacterized protein F5891DRAFT_314185 [Suillus fuscotomentosus]|uniref:Uncharacterized protein n=1 Tax=Suillus fuscotomentosus TaxID=1912939 RepID=A0AAD4HLD0_9AGAM|nr:uncharacterized protein F5891DRAFT_314185 [Suillus fuscotomentosus]KAG1900431.1 hypothetical protein F5891DRAFT_314185 [Suillus fuscotomentosus]
MECQPQFCRAAEKQTSSRVACRLCFQHHSKFFQGPRSTTPLSFGVTVKRKTVLTQFQHHIGLYSRQCINLLCEWCHLKSRQWLARPARLCSRTLQILHYIQEMQPTDSGRTLSTLIVVGKVYRGSSELVIYRFYFLRSISTRIYLFLVDFTGLQASTSTMISRKQKQGSQTCDILTLGLPTSIFNRLLLTDLASIELRRADDLRSN